MSKEEVIKKLASNMPACWIFWEIRNLKDTFEEPDEFEIKENGSYKGKGHSLADAIENMVNSLMKLIGLPDEYAIYDIFDTLEIVHARDKNGADQFIIS